MYAEASRTGNRGETATLSVETAERLLARSIIERVCLYTRQRRFEEAHQLLRQGRATVKDPEQSAFFCLALGRLSEKQKDYPAAVAVYSDGIRLEPADVETWYFLHNNAGRALNVLGRYAAAERYCRRAIAINPEPYHAYKDLGICLAHMGWHHEARAALRIALARVTDTPVRADSPEQREAAGIQALIRGEESAISQEVRPPCAENG